MEFARVKCEILAVGPAAILILSAKKHKFWIPKSQILKPDHLVVSETSTTVSMAKWIAKQKGLI